MEGSVQLDCKVLQDQVNTLVLDSSFLDIKSIASEGSDLSFKIEERHPIYGSKIIVNLSRMFNQNEMVKITVKYSTTEKCTAVQW